ncbi:hypothetical protein [Leptothoe sp. PORK10 BA2]|uniref:hypothetical protein n=1 Tax=Leptothoe sp. PORK10 BA2 TaxID=3110254 RepID=UPI002B1FFC65|nr:hypothetical protein [Leptothoe sp. PORK10 BA2]MEA5466969.1 hypothetical protein [Leptothoe sp. PORK10 BA2]
MSGEVEYRESVRLKFTYFYATDGTYAKYRAAVEACGWQQNYLLNQFTSSFVKKNLEYYQEALAKMAAAMDIPAEELYELCRSDAEPILPKYVNGHPDIGPSPLAPYWDLTTQTASRRTVGGVKMSGRNAVAFRLAAHIDRESVALTISRIAQWHLDTYWDRIYAPQLAGDLKQTL